MIKSAVLYNAHINPIVSQWQISQELPIPLHLLVCDISLLLHFILFPGDLCISVCVFVWLCIASLGFSVYTQQPFNWISVHSSVMQPGKGKTGDV